MKRVPTGATATFDSRSLGRSLHAGNWRSPPVSPHA